MPRATFSQTRINGLLARVPNDQQPKMEAFLILANHRGMSLRLPLNAIPNRAYPIGKQRDVKPASNRLRFSGIL
jgi:hypothetical protein